MLELILLHEAIWASGCLCNGLLIFISLLYHFDRFLISCSVPTGSKTAECYVLPWKDEKIKVIDSTWLEIVIPSFGHRVNFTSSYKDFNNLIVHVKWKFGDCLDIDDSNCPINWDLFNASTLILKSWVRRSTCNDMYLRTTCYAKKAPSGITPTHQKHCLENRIYFWKLIDDMNWHRWLINHDKLEGKYLEEAFKVSDTKDGRSPALGPGTILNQECVFRNKGRCL